MPQERAQIRLAFERLDAELGRRGVRAECFVVGSAVLCVALDARPSTKDVDAWFSEPSAVRAAAAVVAEGRAARSPSSPFLLARSSCGCG